MREKHASAEFKSCDYCLDKVKILCFYKLMCMILHNLSAFLFAPLKSNHLYALSRI